MTISSETVDGKRWERVVIRLQTEVIKGFLEVQEVDTLDALLQGATSDVPSILRVRRLDSESVDEIETENAKAVFFVTDFVGDSQHNDLQFHKRAPLAHGVWIRIEFFDGESMEGLVHNTVHFISDPGFFIRPTDPRSNNHLVYVLKKSLRDCRILGLRNI